MTLIAFIGSVFSPYYAWAGRKRPENHVSVNVALYGDGWSRWAMTERRAPALSQHDDGVDIGPSALRWTGSELVCRVRERSVPHLGRLDGEIRVDAGAVMRDVYDLCGTGRHFWRPIAPSGRVSVDFAKPDFRWSGAGYVDMNWGSEPLEAGFRRWDWSRAPLGDGGAAILYDGTQKTGDPFSLALRFDGAGGVTPFAPPPRRPLAKGIWRLERGVQAEDCAGGGPRILRRLEDSPFYARSEIESRLCGETVHAMHETLDADRFAQPWVKGLLPFRMPRV